MPLVGFAQYPPDSPFPRGSPPFDGLPTFRHPVRSLVRVSSVGALSWFFGPSLLPPFGGSLRYYGLC